VERTARSVVGVAEFLLELYIARTDAAAMSSAARRARLAAHALTGQGTPVRLLRSIFVAEDETCLLLFEAASADAVRTVAGHAGLPLDHLAEVVAEWTTEGNQPCPS
jgi:hypothetical protein